MKKLGLVLMLLAMMVWFVPPAAAQSNCKPFMAIAQAELLNPAYLLRQEDVWGGPVFAKVGDELLSGLYSENDGTPVKTPPSTPGVPGMGRGGTGIYWFNEGADWFTVEVGTAVWPYPPGKNGFGHWRGNAKITGGYGLFKKATGHISGDGPFIWWLTGQAPPAGMPVAGRWNPTMNGVICGVQFPPVPMP